MPRKFHLQRFGDPGDYSSDLDEHKVVSASPIIRRYNAYGLMLEDVRTVIELNKTIEDILTERYIFLKLWPLPKMLKRKDPEDVQFETETYNTLLIQSLFTTSVVTYARWFTHSTSKKPRLEPSEVFKKAGKRTKLTHELVMTYRHEYFAHSGETHLEASYPLYITDPAIPGDEHLFSIPQKKRLPGLTEVRSFDRLFRKVLLHVQSKMQAMKPRVIQVIKEEIEKKGAAGRKR